MAGVCVGVDAVRLAQYRADLWESGGVEIGVKSRAVFSFRWRAC